MSKTKVIPEDQKTVEVIANHTVKLGGETHAPGTTIKVPEDELKRLRDLGAVRMPKEEAPPTPSVAVTQEPRPEPGAASMPPRPVR